MGCWDLGFLIIRVVGFRIRGHQVLGYQLPNMGGQVWGNGFLILIDQTMASNAEIMVYWLPKKDLTAQLSSRKLCLNPSQPSTSSIRPVV